MRLFDIGVLMEDLMIHDLENNKKLVLKFFEMMSDKDARSHVDSIVALFADDVTYSMIGSYGLGGVFTKEQIVQIYHKSMSVLKEGFKFKIHSITAEENRILVEAQNTCMFINDELYDNFYIFAFVVEYGKIQRITEYLDTLYLYKAFERVEAHSMGTSAESEIANTGMANRAVDSYFSNPIISF